MKRVLRTGFAFAIACLPVMTAFVVVAGPASAATTVTWTGNGSENLPCESGGHWILGPAQGITSATLTVNGVTYTMTRNGVNGSYSADSSGPLDSNTTASATYTGTNTSAFLKLSGCSAGGPPPPPPPA